MKQIHINELLIMSRKALVIGCTGQDGSYLMKYLLGKGYKVLGTSRSTQKDNYNHKRLGINGQFPIIKIDPANFYEVRELLLQENPNEVYNFSAQSSVGQSFKHPIETQKSISLVTISILEACKSIDFEGTVFFAGSSEIYGNTIKPASIDSAINPKSPYAIAKIESMQLVRLYREIYNLKVVTGVLFPHESSLRNERFVTHKIITGAINCLKNKSHKFKIGNLNIERDWGWAEEYIEGIYLITTSKLMKDQIICTGQSTSLKLFIEKVFQKLSLNWQDHVVIDKHLFRARDINKSLGNPLDMYKDLNWQADIQIDEIIDRLIESKSKAL